MEILQSKERARGVWTTATSGDDAEVGRVAISGLFKTTKLLVSNSAASKSPRASEAPCDHSSLWPFKSPRTMASAVRRGAKEAWNPAGDEEAGGT